MNEKRDSDQEPQHNPTRREDVVAAVNARLTQLAESPHSDVKGLSFEIRDNVVILRGRASTFRSKQETQEAIRDFQSTIQIANEIIVDTEDQT